MIRTTTYPTTDDDFGAIPCEGPLPVDWMARALEAVQAHLRTYAGYVDDLQAAQKLFTARLATTANHALTGVTAIDGVVPVAGNTILVKSQTAHEEDGLYVAAAGAWARLKDSEGDDVITPNMIVNVSEGTVAADTQWVLTTNAPITVGVTVLAYVKLPNLADLASTANGKGASLIGVEDPATQFAGATGEAVFAEIGGRILGAAANEAAIKAIVAGARVNGQLCVDLTNDVIWTFDTGSAAGASAWVLVPDAGTGRWLRNHPSLADLASTVATYGASMIGVEDVALRIAALQGETALHELAGRVVIPAANAAAIQAIPAAAREDGSIVVDLALDTIWTFDSGSAAGASAWVLVPDAGTGRWLRNHPSLADLASVVATYGASLIGVEDANGRLTAAEGEAAFGELAGRVVNPAANVAAIRAIPATARVDGGIVVDLATLMVWVFDAGGVGAASDWVLVPDAGTGRWLRADTEPAVNLNTHRPGVPMQNRLRALGAPGALAPGDTIVIGADTYEMNVATPPAAGTVGFIWVYNDASSAAGRVNLIDAINGVVDANRIGRGDGLGANPGDTTEAFLAAAGVTVGDIQIQSADAAGGTPTPSAVATACTTTLSTGTDIWDSATCLYGKVQAHTQAIMVSAAVGAEEIAKGTLEVEFGFTPTSCILVNRSRPQDEVYTIVGDAVSLALAGGASPNNQAGDVIDIIAFG